MSVIILQAVLAAFAAITFGVALRMRSRSRVVTMAFPQESEVREALSLQRRPALV